MTQTPLCLRAVARIFVALAAVSPLASASSVPSPDPVLSWRLYTGSEPPPICEPSEGEALACGTWGEYRLAKGSFPTESCGSTADGAESPPAFVPSGWPVPPPGAWFPCRDGGCFETESVPGAWAAVVDWNDPHGWSVGETLLQAGDRRVAARLFPLDEPPSSVEELLEDFPVGDAHLLAQLCALAEELEAGPENPPLVVNISAGRHAGASGTGGGGAPTLASQILGLIDHLTASPGIAFVAAAGHHRTQLFPAHLPPVLAAGPVDLPRFRHTQETAPSWQADGGLRGLFPAHGLELYSPGPEPQCWPVPAGASFASATAAGWIAAYRTLEGNWEVGDAEADWAPIEVDGRIYLSRDWSVLPDTDLDGPSALVAGAFGGLACGGAPVGAHAVLDVGAQLTDPIDALPSLVELAAEIGPSPENEPCVPCDIPSPFGPGPEILRLHASLPLAPDYRIVDLYLLTDGTFHRLRSAQKRQILDQLEDGTLLTLELRGFGEVYLQPWHEALLVFQLAHGAQGLWTSVPIDVLPP
jgi:hypothetical protein